MPRVYAARKQRNRRRTGNVRFAIDAVVPPACPTLQTILVSGAGEPGIDGTYTFVPNMNRWENGSILLNNTGIGWQIEDGVTQYYSTSINCPMPTNGNWIQEEGANPVPTVAPLT